MEEQIYYLNMYYAADSVAPDLVWSLISSVLIMPNIKTNLISVDSDMARNKKTSPGKGNQNLIKTK